MTRTMIDQSERDRRRQAKLARAGAPARRTFTTAQGSTTTATKSRAADDQTFISLPIT